MFATARWELAAALSTVTTDTISLTGHETRPTMLRVGDAWPQLANVERGPGQTWEATWVVLVLLPEDGKRAAEAMDALFHTLTDALASALYVEQVTPVALVTAAGERPALQITGRSE